MIRPTYDPKKQGTHANLSGDLVPHDQIRSKSPNILHAPTHDKAQDPIHFGRARSLLINKWQTMGMAYNQQRHVTLVKG
jgi:hypothetical protein